MRKSRWIEWVEWLVCALVLVFVLCVVANRHEITSAEAENPKAPAYSLDE
jgi:hypothetical protein